MIVANVSHTLINCTCKNRLGFSLLPFTLIPQYLQRFNWSTQWNPLTFGLFSLASIISRSFQTVRRVREARMFGLSLFRPSRQSNIPTSVPRRAKKCSNIPLPGRTRSVKCPTPGPTKTIKSPPHPLPPPLPALHWWVQKSTKWYSAFIPYIKSAHRYVAVRWSDKARMSPKRILNWLISFA